MMSFDVKIDILTHEPYRVVCECGWEGVQERWLSDALRLSANHRQMHKTSPFLEHIPAPMKPSQVIANV